MRGSSHLVFELVIKRLVVSHVILNEREIR